MAQRCDIGGKGPSVVIRSAHAHKLTKRRWLPNLVSMRAKLAGTTRRVRVCTRCLKAGKVTKVILSTRTNGRGRRPSRLAPGGRPPPPTADLQHLLLLLFLRRLFFISVSPPLVLGFTAPAPSVAHRLATEVLGLLTPPPLVAQKVGVELWQTHHP